MSIKPLVLITGASSGIGAACAARFGKEGFRLALLARRANLLEELQKELGKNTFIYPIDLCDEKAVLDTFKGIEKDIGPIEVLINNAGGAFGTETADEANPEDWKKCIDININGLLYATRAALPFMVERKRGHIINLGSIAGSHPYKGGNVYGGTKAFVHQFSLNLREDLMGKNIRVSCIEPGLVGGTEFSLTRFRGDENRVKALYEGANALTAQDVAETIYFCYSLPPHVNINTIEMMPVTQGANPLAVVRNT